MTDSKEQLSALHDIKKMMEKSSRFISLSGWSGIAAGTCALVGAYFAHRTIFHGPFIYLQRLKKNYAYYNLDAVTLKGLITDRLFIIAVLTFIAAFVSAFLFTYFRSKKNNTPIWSSTTRRLTINVVVPMIVGGIFIFRLAEVGTYGLIAPACLIFYGLGLINGSKYTLGEIKYLGYCELVLGIICCWFVGWGLYFWAVGFGILHIVYGTVMWYKYERIS